METTFTGRMQPLDAEEFAEIAMTVGEDGMIESASYVCADSPLLRECCEALCSVLVDKPAKDVMQINNNAVYYNMESDLPLHSLYLATIAVQAAKKAALAYLKANGVEYDGEGMCDCLK